MKDATFVKTIYEFRVILNFLKFNGIEESFTISNELFQNYLKTYNEETQIGMRRQLSRNKYVELDGVEVQVEPEKCPTCGK